MIKRICTSQVVAGLMLASFASLPAFADQAKSAFAENFSDLLNAQNSAIAPADELSKPTQTTAGRSHKSSPSAQQGASASTAALRASRSTTVPPSTDMSAIGTKSDALAGPQYGKPLADSLDQEARNAGVNGENISANDATNSVEVGAQHNAASATLAPFHTVGGGLSPLSSVQRPRPINIPKDASPALRQAAEQVSNLSVVSPRLIRGAQPTTQALALLKAAGVKTVVNLRNEDILVEREAADCKRLGLNYVSIPMAVFDNPTKTQFLKFLSIVDSSGPVFVHCQRGEDRTGTMVAAYRIGRENWDANRAYQEMTAMGFKTYLGSLSSAVFDYSASLGRPGRRPGPDFSGFTSVLKH